MPARPALQGLDGGRYQFEPGSLEFTVYCNAPRLRPDAVRLVVPPGHRAHEEGTLVAQGQHPVACPPVVHETGVTDGSPGNEYRNPSDLVVDHLPPPQIADGIGA